jgi:hypothetical protein
MTPLRKLVSVAFWACLLISYSVSINAQNLDPVTGLNLNSTTNILNLGGGLPWNGTVTGAAGGTSGGPTPAYNPSTGNIIFSYASRTVSQTVAINQALANAGSGVQLSGYRYQWQINNDLNNYEGNRGTLTGNVSLKGATGNIVESFNYNYNQNLPSFTSFSGTQFFNNRYDIASASSLTVSFTGRDQNNWAGYYGPRVHVDSFNLLYTVDPCKLNPAYSSTCSGFSSIVTSGNLLNPNLMSNGDIVYNSFAVNTALKSSGAGVEVYGFNYGYNYSLGNGTYGCTATNQDGSCSWYMTTNPNAQVRVRLTDINNNVVYSAAQSRSTPNTAENVSYQFLLPSTTNSLSLGTFTMGANTSGNATVQNMYANALYKPDPCVKNPLYSPDCSGFAQATVAKLSTSNTTSTPTAEPPTTASTSVVTTASVSQSNSSLSTPQQTSNTTATKGSPQSKTVAAALSIIAKNQQREQAIQNSAVQTATSEAAAAGDKAQQQALSVASAAVTMSQTLSNVSVQTQRQSNTTTASATVSQAQPSPSMINAAPLNNENKSTIMATTVQTAPLKVSTPVVATVSSTTSIANDSQYSMISAAQSYFNRAQVTQPIQATITSSPPPQPNKSANTTVATAVTPTITTPNTPVFSQSATDQQSFMNFAYVQSQNTMFYAMAAAPVEQPQQTTVQAASFARQAEIEQVNNTVGFMTNRTDPLNEVVESKPVTTTNNTTESTQTVKATVTDNELAGGVDINKMATTPIGYNNYTNLVLKDGKMYEPKEIYKNQTPVDNARALRQLSTDRLHQQMIEQQYRR